MKKRIWLSILLAAILVLCTFALCSCGGNGGENDQTENNSQTQPSCEHQYQGTVSQEGTCETDEIITYTCALCQHTYSMTTPAMGHDLVNHSEKTPTCTEIGWNAYVTCSRCAYTTYEEKPAGHDVIEHEAKAPNCVDIGWDAYVTCSRCDYTTYEKLTPHTMENGECIVCHTPESTPGLSYKFNSDSKSYTVTGIGTCTESAIVIGIYNGYSVTSIGSYAFKGCNSLTSVTIGNSVISIGNDAFYSCSNLTSIVIPDSVTSIGSYAFKGCNSLTSIVIPDSVTSIGNDAFYNCYSLTSVTIGNSVTSIGNEAFSSCTSLTSIVIPDSVTSIGEWAFKNCKSLTSITVDENNSAYKSIDGNLYTKDEKMLIQYAPGKKDTEFKIPNGVTSIGDNAFTLCTSLTSIVIPDSVTSIGRYAFYDCDSLTSATIGNSVTSIGEWAFFNCYSLTSIVIPDSVTSIGSYAFFCCDSITIYCEAGSKPSGWDNYWDDSIRPVVWGHNNITTNSEYDYVLHNGKAHLTKYKGDATEVIIPSSIDGYEVEFFGSIFGENQSITSVEIPNSVTSIGHYAFSHCTSLTSVTIGNGVTSIGKLAFCDCDNLTSVTIGNGVTSIGEWAFYSCTSLTSIVIPNSVTSIGDGAFCNCTSLTSVTIGNGVTSIGDDAFDSCYGLTSIVIPDSVTSIGEGAFYNCTSLTIYCEATSQPSGWHSDWNYYPKRPVVWGYKAD